MWPSLEYGGGENVSRLGETIIGEEGEQERERKKKKKKRPWKLELSFVVQDGSGDAWCVVGKAPGSVRTVWVLGI